MYQVLARKWRPRNFDEVVGQGQVTRTLANAIAADRLAHAYIFAGIRGTGKTSVARILAKSLNCEQGPTATPCDQCTACAEIAESRAMDVLELDAASRTGVDNIRELQEVISYAPARDRFKVLIIDEAHMLSKAAFNALLKTLEEPPPNVIFILATTEIQKVLPTILSRCQVFEFRRVGVRELSEHLGRICEAEKIRISESGLERIARAGEGSVRDSLSVLERMLAFCGNEIEDDDLLRMLGGVRLEVLESLVRGLGERDAGAMLQVLDGLIDEGHDLLHFWGELIAVLRDLMLMRAVPDQAELLSRSAEEAGTLNTAAANLSPDDLARAFQVLADLELGLKASAQPRFMFEAALIRLASLGAVRPIEEILGALRSGQPAPSAPPPVQKKKAAAEPASRPTVSEGDFAAHLIRDSSEENGMLGVILEEAASIRLSEGALVLQFAADKDAMVRQLERKDLLDQVGKFAGRLAGKAVRVQITRSAGGATPVETPSVAPVAAPVAAETPVAVEAPVTADVKQAPAPQDGHRRAPRDRNELLERARQDPGVKRLLHEFGAQVVEIRPVEAPKNPATNDDGIDDPEENS